MSQLKYHNDHYQLVNLQNAFQIHLDTYNHRWQRYLELEPKIYEKPQARLGLDAMDCINLSFQAQLAQKGLEGVPIMRFGLDLLHAHYNLVSNPGQRHIFTLKDHVFRLEGCAEHREIMVDNWLLQLSLALCLRDADATELICRCEADWLEFKEPFNVAMFNFVRNIFVQETDQTKLLREVMEKSGPEHVDEFRAPYVNKLFLPYLDVWVALLSNDEAHYKRAIHTAIELHYKFYIDPPEGAVTWEGDVALLISAVASLAYDKHGWQVPDTPYLPKWLIYKEFENA
ncbi:hypothetical protein CWC17_14765 [Pseudoalteromonas sp. S3785]|uniref:immunity 49 family protein n=1 Tax=Pseudoalteromonas sp. S3785 TaxID=579545 RepID=UPI00110AA354|nr:immunity 49 family protein [Pseudoalteromonas sp. S3785]TMO72192.1 hypothetical protein CWC17_14765 [Pseudoalteromonas sp. S3785]